MSEPTRPIRPPTVDRDGSLVAHTVATPKSFKVRALVTVAPRKVIPVIFVPGIMGTNLRVKRDAVRDPDSEVEPGAAVWRAPTGGKAGALEALKWLNRNPRQRQLALNAKSLEVDDGGLIELPAGPTAPGDSPSPPPSLETLRERGWGEVHAGSYGKLLAALEGHLNSTFNVNASGGRQTRLHWQRLMKYDTRLWDVRGTKRLSDEELVKYAAYQYPVYAVGYNWLQSCARSADRLEQRINEIIAFWKDRKHQCEQVILVTHSMGGLVARACAKRIPHKIAGIVHGAMPSVGAPVAYRRIACGTEVAYSGDQFKDELEATGFSVIAGSSAAETTAVMATAPGVLELLPNQSYPGPWLHLRTVSVVNKEKQYHDWVNLPAGSPYAMYRDLQAWYRLIDPALADPANLYGKGRVERAIGLAIDQAEQFHTKVLDGYYHPNTYAFYGADTNHRAFSRISWIAEDKPVAGRVALTPAMVRDARTKSRLPDGGRCVEIAGHILEFKPDVQDAFGDGTVPEASGACTGATLKQVFRPVAGFDHQASYEQADVLELTKHLIAKIVQDVK
jgi:pimeloyl-ACP methyl ester carboxylesterase